MKEIPTASIDRFATIMTVVVAALILVTYSMYFAADWNDAGVWGVVIAVLLFLILPLSYMLRPRLFVSPTHFEMRSILYSIKLPIREIKMVERDQERTINIRTFGIGGVFGYFGYYNGKDLWLVTNKSKRVVLKTTKGKTYVVSPQDPLELINEIKKYQ